MNVAMKAKLRPNNEAEKNDNLHFPLRTSIENTNIKGRPQPTLQKKVPMKQTELVPATPANSALLDDVNAIPPSEPHEEHALLDRTPGPPTMTTNRSDATGIPVCQDTQNGACAYGSLEEKKHCACAHGSLEEKKRCDKIFAKDLPRKERTLQTTYRNKERLLSVRNNVKETLKAIYAHLGIYNSKNLTTHDIPRLCDLHTKGQHLLSQLYNIDHEIIALQKIKDDLLSNTQTCAATSGNISEHVAKNTSPFFVNARRTQADMMYENALKLIANRNAFSDIETMIPGKHNENQDRTNVNDSKSNRQDETPRPNDSYSCKDQQHLHQSARTASAVANEAFQKISRTKNTSGAFQISNDHENRTVAKVTSPKRKRHFNISSRKKKNSGTVGRPARILPSHIKSTPLFHKAREDVKSEPNLRIETGDIYFVPDKAHQNEAEASYERAQLASLKQLPNGAKQYKVCAIDSFFLPIQYYCEKSI